MLGDELSRGQSQLECTELESLALEARDDLPDLPGGEDSHHVPVTYEATMHAVGLDHDVRALGHACAKMSTKTGVFGLLTHNTATLGYS